MKVLLDSCVSESTALGLRSAGHDAEWVGDWSEDPGDDVILSHAYSNDQVLITLDKDFGALAVLHGQPHCGILRLVNLSVTRHAAVCVAVLRDHGSELIAGAIVTAEPGRVRIRQTPGQTA